MLIAVIDFRIHGIGEFDAAHAIGPCVWPHFDLLTVLSGEVWIEFAGPRRVELARPQAILIYPHTHFVGASIARRSVAAVQHFHVGEAAGALGAGHPLGRLHGKERGYEICSAHEPAALVSEVRRAVHLAHDPTMSRRHALRESLLTLILSELAPRGSATPESEKEETIDAARLIPWVTANLHRKISLDEMAGIAGSSTSHFRAGFTRQFGEPPGTFVRKARHLEAARLLRETRLPTKLIARKLGYDDIAHFHRFFSRIAKLTPKAYRERHQLKG